MGLGYRWQDVKEAYRKIAEVYERANKVATFGQVDKWRREAVRLLYSLNGKTNNRVLDVGAGPGNMARHLVGVNYVVALDVTVEMLRLNDVADDRVVGDFENMPFRDSSFDLLIAGYSLHAARSLEKALAEFSRVANLHAVVSIGKPDNKVVKTLLYIYTRFVLPKIVCLFVKSEVCREYEKIHLIVSTIEPNSRLLRLLSRYAEVLHFEEKGLGAVYIYVSRARRGSQTAT